MSAVGYYQKPRWSFWRWLGFGACRARFADDDPNDPEINPGSPYAPGYMMVETVNVLDWRDRLRVLVSGRVMVSIAVRTDKVITKSISVGACSVLRPSFKEGDSV